MHDCLRNASILMIILLALILLIISSTVAVAATDEAPVLKVIGDRSVNENYLLSFTLSATDSDNDSFTFSSPDIESRGADLNASSGLFEWTPTYEQSGSYLVQFVVSDGSHIDSEYITITVNNVNRLPVFSAIPDNSTNENEQVQLILEATDDDSDILAFSKDVSFGTLEGNVFTWTPDYDSQGEHTIVFSVTDGSSSVTQTAVINVSNVNRDPVLFSISDVSVPLNEPVTIQLNGFDADGDDLNYSIVSGLPAGASFDSETGLFQWPNPDSAGRYHLSFSVSDGSGSDTKYSLIVVGDSGSPPVLNTIGAQSVDENSELSFEITASDTDKLTFASDYLPGASLVATSSSSAQFTWTPTYEQAGNYKLEFWVSDNSQYRFVTYQVVDIVVSDVNRAPTIDAVDDYSVNENGILYVNLSATDPDGDTLTYSTNSSLGVIRGNTFICSPGYTDAGVYDVLFTVSDGSLSNSTTATITVTDTNMPPKISSLSSRKVAVNSTLEFSLSVYDEDEDNSFTFETFALPAGASFDESTALFEWTPSSDQVGEYSVSFYVSDGSQEDYETVSITVVNESSSDNDDAGSSSSGGSGGGGGGSQNTGEKYENIDFKDFSIKYVMKDKVTLFEFDEPQNNVVSISFISKLNAGQTKALVEILKGTSGLVNNAPPGDVYKNLNIWVGDSKFPSDVIHDVAIKFRVDKSWIDSEVRDYESVKLYRYSENVWQPLETASTGEDEEYFYYEAESPGFSSFAILIPYTSDIIMMDNVSLSNEAKMSIDDKVIPVEDQETSQSSKKSLILLLTGGFIAVVSVAGIKYRPKYEELYMKIGNPDGKRYRRIKK